MFDPGISYLIDGAEIDRPRNAITLTHFLHQLFGDFRIFFEAVSDQQPHTYQIGTFLPRYVVREPPLPITRTLYLAENRAIDPPLPRLLAVHYAITRSSRQSPFKTVDRRGLTNLVHSLPDF